MNFSQPATDDGSRIAAHFFNTSLKASALTRFEADSNVSAGFNKRAVEAAAAYLQDLTISRSAFLSKLDSSAADTDAEVDDAVSEYLSLLLGLVNNYAEANTHAELDQETGKSRRVSIVHSTYYWYSPHHQVHLQMQGCKPYWEQVQKGSMPAMSTQLSANKCRAMHHAGILSYFNGKTSW